LPPGFRAQLDFVDALPHVASSMLRLVWHDLNNELGLIKRLATMFSCAPASASYQRLHLLKDSCWSLDLHTASVSAADSALTPTARMMHRSPAMSSSSDSEGDGLQPSRLVLVRSGPVPFAKTAHSSSVARSFSVSSGALLCIKTSSMARRLSVRSLS